MLIFIDQLFALVVKWHNTVLVRLNRKFNSFLEHHLTDREKGAIIVAYVKQLTQFFKK